MAEQQKMREDLKVHKLQTKEREKVRIRIVLVMAMRLLTIGIRQGKPKETRRLEEEIEFLKQQVESLRLSKAQAHENSAKSLSSPLERSSTPSPFSVDPPMPLPLVESPRSPVAPPKRKMGWASRSKAGFPIPTGLEGSIDFTQSYDLRQFVEEPLPGLSVSRPIVAEAELEEIGAASTFVYPEDDISLFDDTAASAMSAAKETHAFPSTEKLTSKTGSRRRARPKVLDPFTRGQL